MPSPIVNLSDVTLTDHTHGEYFEAKLASLGPLIGARQLGARLCIIPPGKAAWPFHAHVANEEMVVVLAGCGSLRLGEHRHPLKAGDVVSLAAGGIETAHQIVNDSDTELRYLALSTMHHPEVAFYPDSGKFGVLTGAAPGDKHQPRLFEFFGHAEDHKGYWHGED